MTKSLRSFPVGERSKIAQDRIKAAKGGLGTLAAKDMLKAQGQKVAAEPQGVEGFEPRTTQAGAYFTTPSNAEPLGPIGEALAPLMRQVIVEELGEDELGDIASTRSSIEAAADA
jgi:hypothetical protein